jgi:hypothetical protein
MNREERRQWRRRGASTNPRWPYADDWHDVFERGFVDALRLLCRECPDAAVWTAAHTLSAGMGGDE